MKLLQIPINSLSTIMLLISLIISLLLGSSYVYAQEFYKWVDANGSTHYTTTPSPKGVKRLNKVSTYADQPSNAQKQASTSAKNAQLRAQRRAEDESHEAYRSILEASSAVESAMRAAENAAREQMPSAPAASAYPRNTYKRK